MSSTQRKQEAFIFSKLNLTACGAAALLAASIVLTSGCAALEKEKYMFQRRILLDHRMVVDADLRNFPVLIAVAADELKAASCGGHVSSDDGRDILFVSPRGKALAHEIERYDHRQGELRAWVRLPKFSHTADTALYIRYGGRPGNSGPQRGPVWDSHYMTVLHARTRDGGWRDATANGNHGKPLKNHVRVPHSKSLACRNAITVEAWVHSDFYQPECLQAVVSKWRQTTDFNAFDAHDADNTSGLPTRGFLGAVFDGRYVYFVPQWDGRIRDGKVLRYDTHGDFHDAGSWLGYNAEKTSGLKTRGYYGAVYDGRYVYFVPRHDGTTSHGRILRYDTYAAFTARSSWSAFSATEGKEISYQSAAFDGRYIYFTPGYDGLRDARNSGKVLRYDTLAAFTDPESYALYDAGKTSGLNTTCYDGAGFDGRYVYFAPLNSKGQMLRYDTRGGFANPTSWTGFDAHKVSGLTMGRCVGNVFDGRYMYYVPYAHSVVVRYDTHRGFTDSASWNAFNAANTSGLNTRGYDGAVFDGRYVYFIPFWEGKSVHEGFHGKFLRYDTRGRFTDTASWRGADAGRTSGLLTVGFNAAAFDGRYIYCAPWREGTTPKGAMIPHGRVLRYDTTGTAASFSLRCVDYGHNGGLCAAVPGPAFLVNTDKGVINVRANRNLAPGKHHLAGVYDGTSVSLFLDGILVNRMPGSGKIAANDSDLTLGMLQDGMGDFKGSISEARISNIARSASWIATQYANHSAPEAFCRLGPEEKP